MKTSESIKNIAPALLRAQRNMGAAKKDSSNPFFKSKYADLGAVMEVCKEALNNEGILVLQPAAIREGKNVIITRLQHESGEFLESESEVVVSKQNDAQAKGAGETYTRRFSLQAMLFIPSEDDDGNYASGKTAPAKPAYQAPAAKPAPAVTAPSVSSAPAALAPATQEVQPANGVAPLQKSSFRKTPVKAEAPAPAAAPSESEWG